jgi:hypothetical protein
LESKHILWQERAVGPPTLCDRTYSESNTRTYERVYVCVCVCARVFATRTGFGNKG